MGLVCLTIRFMLLRHYLSNQSSIWRIFFSAISFNVSPIMQITEEWHIHCASLANLIFIQNYKNKHPYAIVGYGAVA